MSRPATPIRLSAIIVGAAYAVALYLSGVHIQAGIKEALSYLPTALTFLVMVWDVWFWRLPVVQRLARRPWIGGLWSATLIPTPASHIPDGGNRGPIEAYVVVHQTFWSISVRQYTAESRSESKGSIWTDSPPGNMRTLTYTYSNRPREEVEGRSRPHLGTAALSLVGLRPTSISGSYFTDRYTKGDMRLSFVRRDTDYADFGQARGASGLSDHRDSG